MYTVKSAYAILQASGVSMVSNARIPCPCLYLHCPSLRLGRQSAALGSSLSSPLPTQRTNLHRCCCILCTRSQACTSSFHQVLPEGSLSSAACHVQRKSFGQSCPSSSWDSSNSSCPSFLWPYLSPTCLWSFRWPLQICRLPSPASFHHAETGTPHPLCIGPGGKTCMGCPSKMSLCTHCRVCRNRYHLPHPASRPCSASLNANCREPSQAPLQSRGSLFFRLSLLRLAPSGPPWYLQELVAQSPPHYGQRRIADLCCMPPARRTCTWSS
mmetsp:Transcript_38738/g.70543  ORF Transcript_38738/g.70543 Transcript_38738/m.70543 type:complete len:270 (-) Transcript_38738:323-1132(-)